MSMQNAFDLFDHNSYSFWIFMFIILPDLDIDECLKGPCLNGAECENVPGDYRCKCDPGYTGKNCGKGTNIGFSFLLRRKTFHL